MTHNKPYSVTKAICLELAKKLQELGSRLAKPTEAKLREYEKLDRASSEIERAEIQRRLDSIDVQRKELRRQDDIISRELAVALDRAERLLGG